MKKNLLFIVFLYIFSGCYKNHLYVQQQTVDRDFLASSIVGTPDPRQAHPPAGQRLLVGWSFPREYFEEPLTLVCTVRFWNHEEQEISTPLETRRGSEAFYFPVSDKNHKILTYRVDVKNESGEIVESWKHHFWTELIVVESRSSAASTSSSVSAQPRQGSVIETP
ncbi:MAG TPA: hypothetical protein VGM34_01265 [Chlamydiales bacterium]|jgi:hypothetical protein